ncbi:hypothetical protein KIH27_20110 [Mycobacterium sp. M1]|uniref:Polyketide cyclase n=1 Tax=Mycolicibacter acidiphilus TaxID=2835306 RepID=A0ABS5RNK8_9MYCO|nr:hypothetical protein [Mycolicibacter acidiphilus]MBS9535892.1 hypothetical protein [Mycolicibacter acidiphilus]
MSAIIMFAALFGICWLYVVLKTKAKQNIFFRGQYEREKALVGRNLVLTTTAPMRDVQLSLAQYIPDDPSARAAFLGGAMRVTMESPTRIIYKYMSKITTHRQGDEFTASIDFTPIDARSLRAEVSIDKWRENFGVTRRAGIDAMENFMNNVVTAFRAVDPATQVGSA